jgi:ABC-type glycerol-3-phosphate transport system substrate-binding protein
MTKFQIILTSVLGLAVIAGAIAFATSKRNNSNQDAEQIVVWGTFPGTAINAYFDEIKSANHQTVNVSYVYKQPATFEQNLIEAIADGKGPDGILLQDNLIYRLKEKIAPIPFTSYPERSFKDSFVSAEEIYLGSTGIMALPLSIDPLVLYWNRDLVSSAGFSKPPASWEEFFTLAPKLTKKDASGNITQSAIAFGDLSNVSHGKEILATLMLQAGAKIVTFDGMIYRSGITDRVNNRLPAEDALRFFTEFVNPSKDSYSWNKSLPNSFNAFVGGQLAMYVGYSSEFSKIREKNPNLNFDVSELPQTANALVRITYGSSLAFAILKSSPRFTSAMLAFSTLTNNAGITEWVKDTGLTPVRRDILAVQSANSITSVFNRSAIISRTWLDPNPSNTFTIFSNMVDSVASGRSSIPSAINEAHQNLTPLLQ